MDSNKKPDPIANPDWKSQLRPESRRIITSTLVKDLTKKLPLPSTEVQKIVAQFENQAYCECTSKDDYLMRISQKSLSINVNGPQNNQDSNHNFQNPNHTAPGGMQSQANLVMRNNTVGPNHMYANTSMSQQAPRQNQFVSHTQQHGLLQQQIGQQNQFVSQQHGSSQQTDVFGAMHVPRNQVNQLQQQQHNSFAGINVTGLNPPQQHQHEQQMWTQMQKIQDTENQIRELQLLRQRICGNLNPHNQIRQNQILQNQIHENQIPHNQIQQNQPMNLQNVINSSQQKQIIQMQGVGSCSSQKWTSDKLVLKEVSRKLRSMKKKYRMALREIHERIFMNVKETDPSLVDKINSSRNMLEGVLKIIELDRKNLGPQHLSLQGKLPIYERKIIQIIQTHPKPPQTPAQHPQQPPHQRPQKPLAQQQLPPQPQQQPLTQHQQQLPAQHHQQSLHQLQQQLPAQRQQQPSAQYQQQLTPQHQQQAPYQHQQQVPYQHQQQVPYQHQQQVPYQHQQQVPYQRQQQLPVQHQQQAPYQHQQQPPAQHHQHAPAQHQQQLPPQLQQQLPPQHQQQAPAEHQQQAPAEHQQQAPAQHQQQVPAQHQQQVPAQHQKQASYQHQQQTPYQHQQQPPAQHQQQASYQHQQQAPYQHQQQLPPQHQQQAPYQHQQQPPYQHQQQPPYQHQQQPPAQHQQQLPPQHEQQAPPQHQQQLPPQHQQQAPCQHQQPPAQHQQQLPVQHQQQLPSQHQQLPAQHQQQLPAQQQQQLTRQHQQLPPQHQQQLPPQHQQQPLHQGQQQPPAQHPEQLPAQHHQQNGAFFRPVPNLHNSYAFCQPGQMGHMPNSMSVPTQGQSGLVGMLGISASASEAKTNPNLNGFAFGHQTQVGHQQHERGVSVPTQGQSGRVGTPSEAKSVNNLHEYALVAQRGQTGHQQDVIHVPSHGQSGPVNKTGISASPSEAKQVPILRDSSVVLQPGQAGHQQQKKGVTVPSQGQSGRVGRLGNSDSRSRAKLQAPKFIDFSNFNCSRQTGHHRHVRGVLTPLKSVQVGKTGIATSSSEPKTDPKLNDSSSTSVHAGQTGQQQQESVSIPNQGISTSPSDNKPTLLAPNLHISHNVVQTGEMGHPQKGPSGSTESPISSHGDNISGEANEKSDTTELSPSQRLAKALRDHSKAMMDDMLKPAISDIYYEPPTKKMKLPDWNDMFVNSWLHAEMENVEVNYALKEEIKEINARLIDTQLRISEEELKVDSFEGTVVKCFHTPIAVSPDLKAVLTPVSPLTLLVPTGYPESESVIKHKYPEEQSPDDLSSKAISCFNKSLEDLSPRLSLKEITHLWDSSIRKVVLEFAQKFGGGSFSSRLCNWQNCE